MTIEEAVKAVNSNYRKVLYPGPCEPYDVMWLEMALGTLLDALRKASCDKF